MESSVPVVRRRVDLLEMIGKGSYGEVWVAKIRFEDQSE